MFARNWVSTENMNLERTSGIFDHLRHDCELQLYQKPSKNRKKNLLNNNLDQLFIQQKINAWNLWKKNRDDQVKLRFVQSSSIIFVYDIFYFSSQMVATISPLLSSIEDAVEAILLTAHKEEFGQEENIKQPPCSPYMKELQAFLERISKDFLQHFTCKVN